jgi:hypothetical protein
MSDLVCLSPVLGISPANHSGLGSLGRETSGVNGRVPGYRCNGNYGMASRRVADGLNTGLTAERASEIVGVRWSVSHLLV